MSNPLYKPDLDPDLDPNMDSDQCALWIKEVPPVLVSSVFRFRCWMVPALMAAVVFIIIFIVLGTTNMKTSNRLSSAEDSISKLKDQLESLNASLQQTQDSIGELQQVKTAVDHNKNQLTSVMDSLKQLSELSSVSRTVAELKCILERIIANSSAEGPCCPLNWTLFGSDCFYFSSEYLSWNQSRKWCEQKDALLLILHTDNDWDFVTKHTVPRFYWVGLSDWRTGRWEWVNQNPYTMERRRWAVGQPDSGTGHGQGSEDEDCVHLHNDGRLNDLHCNSNLQFICRKRSVHT
ncbi:C-type lectin domain family 10 member A-like [Nematolebias whitei]|uniref:C-type lectin domain family 10 member A-like n=1 Tax=Nematolebias whitei TaxID=451745 RepID=UPI00189C1CB6|nr:C-type lectin domain family 10 member A-like [Nematolebias whitei]